MTLTEKQTKFLKNNHSNFLSYGKFLGDENDFSCLVTRFAKTVADAGYPDTAAQLSLDLQPEGFIHGTIEQLTEHFIKNSPSYL